MMGRRRTDREIDEIKITAAQNYVRASNDLKAAIRKFGWETPQSRDANKAFLAAQKEYKKAVKL